MILSHLRTFAKVVESRQAEVGGALIRHVDTVSDLLVVDLPCRWNQTIQHKSTRCHSSQLINMSKWPKANKNSEEDSDTN